MDFVLVKVTARVKGEQYEPTLGSYSAMHSHLPKVNNLYIIRNNII
jgi:hypothetical protein